MRTLLTVLLAAAMAGSFGTAGDAAGTRRKHDARPHGYGYRAPVPGYRGGYGYRAPAGRYRGAPAYQERLLDSAPFGSQRWWELYNESHEPW
jgi:hypothetical protein